MKIFAALFAFALFCGQALAAAAPTQLRVTNPDGSPATPIVATQTIGSLATPGSYTYRIQSNRGSINWKLGAKPTNFPNWLCANAISGKTAFTLVLTICGPQMPVGISTGFVPVIASTNTVTLSAKITVSAAPPPPPIDPPPIDPPPSGGGACLDSVGGKLTTDAGVVLTCP